MNTTKNVTKKTSDQQYLDAWMKANPGMKNFVSGGQNTGGAVGVTLPDGASREEQDLAQVYQSAYNNAVAIDRRAQNAVLEANKAHDLSMKYLAAQNEANGFGGLGIADTSSIRLSSQYQKALTDAYATKEASLLENYQKMSEDASTIRGEWASREEAKADEKYANTENAILSSDNEDSVKEYLQAAGYEEGTEQYDNLLNRWYLMYGKSEEKNEEVNGALTNTVDTMVESGGITENDVINYRIDKQASVLNPKTITASAALGEMDVKENQKQIAYAQRVIDVSKNWDASMNGTLVDFNFGGAKDPEIYVFFNGQWYKTTYSRKDAKNHYGDRFYSQGNPRSVFGQEDWLRGKSFYEEFGAKESSSGNGGTWR